ncbi:hypothetical protein C0995_004917 [Termitomyces sp. Mi166|nr:hypothetical protein C0995_004917 [Termitomyces sp. Mi166\
MLKFIVLNVLLASSAFATPLTTGFECGSIAHPDRVAAAQERISTSSVNGSTQALKAQGAFNVSVIWNVFYDQNNPGDGNIPDAMIIQQNNIMNSYFQPMRLTFIVTSVRRIAVPYNVVHGAAPGNAVESQLKSYHMGDARTLNIYTVGNNPSATAAAWSSFPWDYQTNPMYDGIIINYNNLPGGAEGGYNTGKESRPFTIMVHEVGHWVGLLHTFQGGCNGGDYVDDTPAEASAAAGCPVGRDTCTAPGADPIDNMMDYSDDACRTRFTSGQYIRFAQMVYEYRGINLY